MGDNEKTYIGKNTKRSEGTEMSLTPEWKEWRGVAKANGISSGTFRRRVRKGMPGEEAATKLLRHVETELRDGLTKEDYKTAEKNGISRQTAYQRYEMMYWDKEAAITKKVHKKRRKPLGRLYAAE